MADEREPWALILGASSGMGEATGLALARAGYGIIGIHLDFRAGLGHDLPVGAWDPIIDLISDHITFPGIAARRGGSVNHAEFEENA